MSNYNSPEYRAIKKCSPDLETAVKNHLTWLSRELSAKGLISESNADSLKNQFIGSAERAAQLVGYVLNGVSLNTDNYHSFVGVLEKKEDDYKSILKILDKKFRELGGRYPLSKPSESYKDDDETLPPAPKRAKAETSLSAASPSQVTIDSSEIIEGTDTAPNEAKTLSSDLKNEPFHWCSFIGQQDLSAPPSAMASSGAYSAVLPCGVNLWKKSDHEVTVAFTHTSFKYFETWKLNSIEKILKLANRWHELQEDPNHIPKFIPFPGQNIQYADIIVELNGDGVSKAFPGNAGKAGSTDPTMWLDLSGKDDDYNEYLVVHEFGHALGLGHEHQRSDFRACVIPFLDETKMRKRLGDRYEDWDTDGKLVVGSATEYDPESVMHYWFKKEWLKYGFDDRNIIQAFFNMKILSEKMRKALLGVHNCSGRCMPTKPSAKDLAFINEEYEKIQA